MRIAIFAVGRLRRGPERQLIDGYAKRLSWEFREREVSPARGRSLEARLGREGELLRQALPPGAVRIALDSQGEVLSSEDLARRLERWREAGRRDLALPIPCSRRPPLRTSWWWQSGTWALRFCTTIEELHRG